ncbi:DUF2198 family protein [Anaerobacillus sp. MEB173]|uniref:DUF2198 family protein n=1 Tax=Anaerobacillus sp. MEB173 TaxID=3383345 RepID=UPI003F9019A4
MTAVLIAIFFPFLLMLFLTRVSYNKYVSLAITIVVLIVAFDGFEQSPLVIGVGVLSTAAGFIGSSKLIKKR